MSCKKQNNVCIQSRDELFMRHSLKCYFGVHFPRCCATREINTKVTLPRVHKPFATRVHTLVGATRETVTEVLRFRYRLWTQYSRYNKAFTVSLFMLKQKNTARLKPSTTVDIWQLNLNITLRNCFRRSSTAGEKLKLISREMTEIV